MNHIPNIPRYSSEYSTLKHQHARTLNMQKLDLSDIKASKRKANPQVFNKDDYLYLKKD